MILKLIGLGFRRYCKDPMNIFDGIIVILSLFELALFRDSNSAISAFRTIRILRVARLFRYMEYMSYLIKVITSVISKSVYLALLLLLFTMIFALLGMQIFGGKFDFEDGRPRGHFDSFHWAFVTIFQVLTLENW
jgi:voltage-dependent calcium channel R type alpha-1E